MSLRTRRKPLQLRHLALMLVLAFGLVAQSVLGVMGDLHESVLHAEAGEAYTHQHTPDAHHDAHHGGHPHDAADDHDAPDARGAPGVHDAHGADDGAGGALHVLEHQSCGGHCAWMDGATLGIPRPHLMASALPVDVTQRLDFNDYTVPFRPPIQG